MIPDKVWDVLELQGVVNAPKLPPVGTVAHKAREKHCSVQLNYPADENDSVFVIVSRQGSQFTGEALKDVEALAIALADCLEQTEPVQLSFGEPTEDAGEPEPDGFGPPPDIAPEEPQPTKRKRSRKKTDLFDEVAAHLEAVGEPEAEYTQEERESGYAVESEDDRLNGPDEDESVDLAESYAEEDQGPDEA